MPHLTLLFFGAAKDVPEAAKMVTAGTAYPQLILQAKGQNGRSFQVEPHGLNNLIQEDQRWLIMAS